MENKTKFRYNINNIYREENFLKLRSRFWLEQDKVRVFGKGPCELLEAIDCLGTLTKATDKLNMSYSKAWSIIKRAEKRLGFLLLESKVGGAMEDVLF